MDKKIHLPENNKRVLSSSLMLVEKSLMEMEELFLKKNDACCYEVLNDVDNDTILYNISIIKEARNEICKLVVDVGVNELKNSINL